MHSVHDRLIYIGDIAYPMAQAMSHAVRTGNPAFDRVFGERYFDHFAHHPEHDAIFGRLMSRAVSDRIAEIVDAYDFSEVKTLVDIGGGHGALLAAILTVASDASGIIFSTPAVVEEARASLALSGVAGRINLVGGDLFDAIRCRQMATSMFCRTSFTIGTTPPRSRFYATVGPPSGSIVGCC